MTSNEALAKLRANPDLVQEFDTIEPFVEEGEKLNSFLANSIIIECNDVKDETSGEISQVFSLYLEKVNDEGLFTKNLIGHTSSLEEAKLAKASIYKYITKLTEAISVSGS